MGRITNGIVTTLLAALSFGSTTVRAQELDTAIAERLDELQTCDDEQCVVETAQSLLVAGRVDDALAYLTEQRDVYPDSGPIQVLLGVSYLRLDDLLWAADTFSRRLDQDPSDCDARLWLAWVDVLELAFAEAVYLLDTDECFASGPTRTRALMMRSLVAFYEGESEVARQELVQAREQESAFEADRDALIGLTRLIIPNRLDELAWNLFLEGGYTTNALLGSPADPALLGAEPSSALIRSNGWIRWAPDFGSLFRPSLEGQFVLLRYLATDAKDLSYLGMGGRIGFFLDWGVPRVFLGYRPDYLLLDRSDEFSAGSTWFYSAHRGELEAELTPWLLTFAGAGRRDFRRLGRSRTEVDGGVGGQTVVIARLMLLWAVAGRGHWARNPAYNLGGISGIASLHYPLPEGWSVRASGTFSADWYPDSAGFFADDARHDTFFKVGGQVWSPFFAGVGFGVVYDYSNRNSTAPEYSFSDHRVTLRINWNGTVDLGRPRRAREPALIDLDWGLEGQQQGSGERIQDLLRQEEQIQQSCGCVE